MKIVSFPRFKNEDNMHRVPTVSMYMQMNMSDEACIDFDYLSIHNRGI